MFFSPKYFIGNIPKRYGTHNLFVGGCWRQLRSPVEQLLSPFPLPARGQKDTVGMSLEPEVTFFLLGTPYEEIKKSRLGVSQIWKKELLSTQKKNKMAFNDVFFPGTLPETKHGPWKWMVGRWLSFWEGGYVRFRVISRGVVPSFAEKLASACWMIMDSWDAYFRNIHWAKIDSQ